MSMGIVAQPGVRFQLLLCLAMGLGVVGAGTTAADPTPRTTFYGGLDTVDVSLAWSALQETLETRVSRGVGTWRNAATGNMGSMTPLRTYRIKIGTYCRDYRETVTRGGEAVAHIATACRDRNGTWIPIEP